MSQKYNKGGDITNCYLQNLMKQPMCWRKEPSNLDNLIESAMLKLEHALETDSARTEEVMRLLHTMHNLVFEPQQLGVNEHSLPS